MLYVIFNPVSGHGRSKQVLPEVCSLLAERELQYTVLESNYAGHVIELIQSLTLSPEDPLVVLGGDGTLFEVVNGLEDRCARLIPVPCGTGNDFIKTLHLPKEPIQALTLQLDGETKPLDVVKLNDYACLNVAGTGFDIDVLRQTEKFKARFSGLLAYLLGLIQAIRFYKPLDAKIQIDEEHFEKKLTLISIANGQYFGGGMHVAPDASPFDGKLDVIVIDAVKKWQICFLLPFFVLGKANIFPFVHIYRASRLKIESADMYVNLDGEIKPIDCADIRISPGMLQAYADQ